MTEHLAPVYDLFVRPKWESSGLPDENWLPDKKRAETPYGALMACAPGDEPEQSQLELFAVKEAIADAFSVLTQEEAWVFDSVVIEGLSYRSIARQLNTSKSSIFRTKKRAVRKLQHALQNHPAVVMQLERLERNGKTKSL
jgi:RNA polymerase sigma factor (sigma-70 family)